MSKPPKQAPRAQTSFCPLPPTSPPHPNPNPNRPPRMPPAPSPVRRRARGRAAQCRGGRHPARVAGTGLRDLAVAGGGKRLGCASPGKRRASDAEGTFCFSPSAVWGDVVGFFWKIRFAFWEKFVCLMGYVFTRVEMNRRNPNGGGISQKEFPVQMLASWVPRQSVGDQMIFFDILSFICFFRAVCVLFARCCVWKVL